MIVVQDQPGQIVALVTITRAKCTGDMIQMVECLLCKCEEQVQTQLLAKKKKKIIIKFSSDIIISKLL
jgi:hypothetical protein